MNYTLLYLCFWVNRFNSVGKSCNSVYTRYQYIVYPGDILKKRTEKEKNDKIQIKRKTVHKKLKEVKEMKGTQPQYDEEFKKSIANLYANGKSQSELHREYGVPHGF